MRTIELQIEGLVGPTHHYAGLGLGNVASANNALSVARPRLAALQSLEHMARLHANGVPVLVMPPQLRPRLDVLKRMQLSGTIGEQLQHLQATAPATLRAIWSASSMWVANAATVTPSTDSADGRLHLTPANLCSSLHRMIEARENEHLLRQLFASIDAIIHPPLDVTTRLNDEGAANHLRLSSPDESDVLHVFVYGASAEDTIFPTRFQPRQQRAAFEAIVKQHGLSDAHCLFVQQHPRAIDAGVFHHDVIGLSHRDLCMLHEHAWVNQSEVIEQMRLRAPWLKIRVIREAELSLEDAVATYFFNAQLVDDASSNTAIYFPKECEEHEGAFALTQSLAAQGHQIHFADVRESMKNGGGPACLRLRIPLTDAELAALDSPLRFTPALEAKLKRFIEAHYPETLEQSDLLDPAQVEAAHATYQALYRLLSLSPFNA